MTKPMLASQRLTARARTRCRRCRSSRRVPISSCSPRSTGSSRRRSHRAAPEARSADARLDLPRGAGASSSARCSATGACRSPRRTSRRRAGDARPRHRGASPRSTDDQLAPAIDRVWRDEIADIARDLRVWVAAAAEIARTGCPSTSSSLRPAATTGAIPPACRIRSLVDGRFKLRGSVDLIETACATARGAPDHRSQDRQEPDDVEDGDRRRSDPAAGALQPGDRAGARHAGHVRPPVLLHVRRRLRRSRDPAQRDQPAHAGLEALRDRRSRDRARLPARGARRARVHVVRLPAVCGPDEERRVRNKSADKLGDLERWADAVTASHRRTSARVSPRDPPSHRQMDRCYGEAGGRRDASERSEASHATERAGEAARRERVGSEGRSPSDRQMTSLIDQHAATDRERPRRHARRRGGGGDGQDDRARQAHRPHPRDRARTRSNGSWP